MTRNKKIAAVVIICVCVLGLLAGTCEIFNYEFVHGSDGPTHVFALPGDGPLTDEQALDFAKQVLIMDHRYSPSLKLLGLGDGKNVNRGDDPQYANVGFYEPGSGREWFVLLTRGHGQVTGVSSAGR